MRRLSHLVVVLGLALPVLCAASDRTATISGYVRNANGVPQMGAAVDLLGTALQSSRVFTDENGFFSAAGLVPGSYSLKVSAPAFLPTLREKISLRAGASILLNLTLSTLFDSVQFSPRRGTTDDGDWDWVLRSTANRPILRILPDGSPAVVAKSTETVVRHSWNAVFSGGGIVPGIRVSLGYEYGGCLSRNRCSLPTR